MGIKRVNVLLLNSAFVSSVQRKSIDIEVSELLELGDKRKAVGA